MCDRQDARLTTWLSGGQDLVWGGALPNQPVLLISSCFMTSLVVGCLGSISTVLPVVRLNAKFAMSLSQLQGSVG